MVQDNQELDMSAHNNNNYHQYIHRYILCLDYVEGKHVLDISSKNGNGTAIVAKKAKSVIGVDSNIKLVRESNKIYKDDNIEFIAAYYNDLPFNNKTFDVVIINEMIDDNQYDKEFIDEIKRVLKHDGIFIAAKSNDPSSYRYAPPDTAPLSKMGVTEFSHFLKRHFDHVRMTGLRMGLVSLSFQLDLADEHHNLPNARTYIGHLKNETAPHANADALWLEQPNYVMALCSQQIIAPDIGGSSLLFSRDQDLWLDHERTIVRLSSARDKEGDLQRDLSQANTQCQAIQEQLAQSQRDYAQLDARYLHQGHQAASTAIISRLLERITGQAIGDDPESIIENLFILNQMMALQRSRLDAVDANESKLADVRSEAAALREKLAEISATLFDTGRSLDQERIDGLMAKSHLAELQQNRLVIEQEAASLRTQLAEAINSLQKERHDSLEIRAQIVTNEQAYHNVLADFSAMRVELETSVNEKAVLRAQHDLQLADLHMAKAQYDRLTVEVANLHSASSEANRQPMDEIQQLAQEPNNTNHRSLEETSTPATTPLSGTTVTISNSTRREIERFVKVHEAVRKQISSASQDIVERLAPRQSRQSGSSMKRWGRKFDRDAAPFKTALFSSGWIATQMPEAANIRFGRYLRDSSLWTLDPHPLFSSAYYLEQNPDVAAESICPLLHYLEHGWREGRNPHPYFLNDWYLSHNPDVLDTLTTTPLEHYLDRGWREGRWPNPLFNPRAYFDRYPDVAEAGIEPLTHYIVHGRHEMREIPLPSINPAWVSLLSGVDQSRGLLNFILAEAPLALPKSARIPDPRVHSLNWPPPKMNDYWLPQQLRDFIIDGGAGNEDIDLYTYLCSVMEAFRETPDTFPTSEACRQVSERIRLLSADRASVLPDQPDASIIIPVYNNVLDTLLCISTVIEDKTLRTYEIIVADDGSSDATPQIIATLGGVVRYLRQPRNYGFLGNCNEAAKQVKGQHIVLLNNDTLVMANWLDALLDTFDLHKKVGLSGSKLISWDGTLQESGGIYWKDGSAWNFGRGGNARAPEFNYVKDVDYISGAAIAIPADIWRAMDGFDEIYAPAYCEDSDIAFRLREAGYRTLLNPRSEVLHHEGRSHGRDLNSGIKAYQVKNQQTFLERWRQTLERDHFPNAENVVRARDRSRYKKHVLVIDHYVPQWDQDAGSRSTFMCIQALLNNGYAVTFWPDNLWYDPQYTPKLQELGVEVIYGAEYRDGFKAFISSRSDLYDAVFANRPHIACNYLDDIHERTNAKIIYYGHDLHYKRMIAAQAVGEPVTDAEIATMRGQELDVCSKADIILYPDKVEVDMVANEIGGNRTFAALPVYAFDKDKFALGAHMLSTIRFKSAYRLLFVGGFNHTPNRDGILWFVQDILPKLQSRLGNIHLTIVGSRTPESVLALAGEHIEVTGFVSDERLAELYDETSLVIAPLRYGGGVKGKVIEAMATGAPLATTPTGAQGLNNPEDLMFIATDAAAFAEAVERALTDRDEALLRATKAWEYANRHYSMHALENLFHKFIG